MKHVVLIPCFDGPTAGYQAALVEDYENEWLDEPIRDYLAYGPWSDALLVARTMGIRWARKHGYRLSAGY